MANEENEFYEKNEPYFYCNICDFKCSYLSDWSRHITTRKHMVNHNKEKMEINGNEFNEKNEKELYNCKYCKNKYKTASGLWKHNKKCDSIIELETTNINNIEPTDKELIMILLKQNAQLIEQNAELVKNNIHSNSYNTTNNTITNSHNKAFNLNFFLNETCKDAMNITDFVDSIQLQLSDLEKVGELGYVDGISNIIVKNLKELDVEKRPVHCTDKKRETMYIKDEDKWEKDEENNKIRKAIKRVASKNQRLIPKFKEVHPDCNTYHSKYSDQYNKLIVESCGGSGDNDLEKEEKIIKNISKNVVVNK